MAFWRWNCLIKTANGCPHLHSTRRLGLEEVAAADIVSVGSGISGGILPERLVELACSESLCRRIAFTSLRVSNRAARRNRVRSEKTTWSLGTLTERPSSADHPGLLQASVTSCFTGGVLPNAAGASFPKKSPKHRMRNLCSAAGKGPYLQQSFARFPLQIINQPCVSEVLEYSLSLAGRASGRCTNGKRIRRSNSHHHPRPGRQGITGGW